MKADAIAYDFSEGLRRKIVLKKKSEPKRALLKQVAGQATLRGKIIQKESSVFLSERDKLKLRNDRLAREIGECVRCGASEDGLAGRILENRFCSECREEVFA
jgi:ribosomal protein S27AE